jgi:hypothetical protein
LLEGAVSEAGLTTTSGPVGLGTVILHRGAGR